ncbi:hypothetical protein HY405_01185 [Candidatus Microgenomates bacterium]|nr:hypothetical protein [Candidatus Microgenomates bacterium]
MSKNLPFLKNILFLIVLPIIPTWLGLVTLESAANIAQILSLAGLVGIFFEIQRSRKELERQKDGLEVNISPVGTLEIKNKLDTQITITGIKQKRVFITANYDPKDPNKDKTKVVITRDVKGAYIVPAVYVQDFQQIESPLYKRFREATLKRLNKLMKNSNPNDKGAEIVPHLFPLKLGWNSKLSIPDSLTHNLSIEKILSVFVQGWIFYEIDKTERHRHYFVCFNSNLLDPKKKWLIYTK